MRELEEVAAKLRELEELRRELTAEMRPLAAKALEPKLDVLRWVLGGEWDGW